MISFLLALTAFAAPATPNSLSDAQIIKVLVTIDEGELKDAGIAKGKAQSQAAKNFATMMAGAHERNLAETKSVAKKEKIGSDKSSLSNSLEEGAKAAGDGIKKADHHQFDKAYLDEQIAMHEKALETLKGSLIPNAKNPALKRHLEATAKDVESHLAMAKSSSAGKDSQGN